MPTTDAGPAAATGWPLAPRHVRLRWWLVPLGVAALHLWLLMLLHGALRSPPAPPLPAQAPVLQVRTLPPALPATLPEPVTEAAPRPERRAPRTAPTPAPLSMPTAPLQAALPASAASAPELAAAPSQAASAAAAAPAPPGRLLDTDATRRAIREAARQPSTAEMGAQATDAEAPLSAQERIGQDISRGARGECLKGEYAGAGMGLLSLPFWLIAEMSDKCRR